MHTRAREDLENAEGKKQGRERQGIFTRKEKMIGAKVGLKWFGHDSLHIIETIMWDPI